MKVLKNKNISIAVDSFGAELTSIKNNQNGVEYLWQGDPIFWKRHSPILFPIVGALWNGKYKSNGVIYEMSQHGFARDMEFDLLRESDSEVFFNLKSNEKTLEKYPFPFELVVGYRLQERAVEVVWQVRNTGNNTMYFQIGAHPAFNYPDFDANKPVKGYLSFDKTENVDYILISRDGCVDAKTTYPLSLKDGVLAVDNHTFDKDALIIEGDQVKKVVLLSKDKQPYLTVLFDAPLVGIWSPPSKNAPFVCIEPWYGRSDEVGFDGEIKDRDWINSLEPGVVFDASYIIELGL